MQIDFAPLSPRDRYKLLVGCLVPRPIALVSTVSRDGRRNAAPFSFFGGISDDPPAVALGVNGNVEARTKDTAANIRETGEFAVNMVDEALAGKMNVCGYDYPADVDEFEVAGLTPADCTRIRAPRVAESPITFECRRLATVEIGLGRNAVIGEVVHLHIRDDLVDPEKLYVHAERFGLIARMHGAGWYLRSTDLFNMPRHRGPD